MKNRPWVIGSRMSKLALVQAQLAADNLKVFYPDLDFEIRTIKTTGDKILDAALNKIGDKGLFTKEIEEALLKGEIDIAVHSMKDLPVELPEGLKISAVTKREDPRDVLVSKQGFTLKSLLKDAKVGTSSLRRRAQLLHLRKDLKIMDLRGNLDTRVKKLEQGLYDAVILAYAGIKRLGLNLRMAVIPIEEILPQAGQGALAVEIRAGDSRMDNLVKVLDDPDSHLCIDAERGLLAGLGGGCQLPIGVNAHMDNNRIFLKAGVFSLDGKAAVRDGITGSKKKAEALGRELAGIILDKGALAILDGLFRER